MATKDKTNDIIPPEVRERLKAFTKRPDAWSTTLDAALVSMLAYSNVIIYAKLKGKKLSEIDIRVWTSALLGSMAVIALSKNCDGNSEIAVTTYILASLGIASVGEEVLEEGNETWWETAKAGSPLLFVLDKTGVGGKVGDWLSGVFG